MWTICWMIGSDTIRINLSKFNTISKWLLPVCFSWWWGLAGCVDWWWLRPDCNSLNHLSEVVLVIYLLQRLGVINFIIWLIFCCYFINFMLIIFQYFHLRVHFLVDCKSSSVAVSDFPQAIFIFIFIFFELITFWWLITNYELSLLLNIIEQADNKIINKIKEIRQPPHLLLRFYRVFQNFNRLVWFLLFSVFKGNLLYIYMLFSWFTIKPGCHLRELLSVKRFHYNI